MIPGRGAFQVDVTTDQQCWQGDHEADVLITSSIGQWAVCLSYWIPLAGLLACQGDVIEYTDQARARWAL